MKTALPSAIKTVEEANNFLLALHNNGEMFHLDDNPSDIITTTGAPLFTADEAKQIENLLNDMDTVCANIPEGIWGLSAIDIILNH